MPDISVPLQDILTDPDHPTDLSTYLRMKPVPSSENSTLSYHHRFREVIESEPSYPNPRYGLALSYAKEGQPDRVMIDTAHDGEVFDITIIDYHRRHHPPLFAFRPK